jgi:hypothetical protein
MLSVALVAAGMVALTLAWPGTSWAQPSRCYKACQIPAKSMVVPKYFACLGLRKGSECSVCPGQPGGQAIQLLTGKSVSCFKACANGFAWNPESRQCCPAQGQAPAPGAAGVDNAELIIAQATSDGRSRVRDLFRALKQLVLESILLPMTKSEKWTVLKKDVEAVKKAAAARGLVVIELGADWNNIMRSAPADTQLSEQQKLLTELAKAAPATTRVNTVVGPPPAVLEYAVIGDVNCPAEPVNITIALDDGTNKTITRTSIEVKRDKAIFRGTVDETEAPVTLMWWPDGRMAGTVQGGSRLYSIRHLGNSMYTVVEMSDERMPNEHAPMPFRLRNPNDPNLRDDPLIQQGDASLLRPAARRPASPPGLDSRQPRTKSAVKKAATQASDIVIDVIVAYTAKAAARYRDIQRELIELAVEEGNESFRMSGLGKIKLRLVHAYQTDYVEQGAHFDHLWRFADKGDGYMEEIHGLRDKYRADVAVLVVDDPEGCGLATRVHADAEEAFAVVHYDCAAVSYSLAHEIGHIIGARHDLNMDRTMSPFPYGHGFVSGTKWRDIMSYKSSCGGCPRLPIWSSPKVIVKGEPAGTPEQDNARVILEEAARVAAFR